MKKSKTNLTDGNISAQLAKLTLPMILGMLGIIAFNLTDTFFVGRLGPDQLAALSFTFPVVMVVQSIALGMGLGSSVLASREAGGGNIYKLRRITTDSLFLGIIIILFISVAGIATVDPLFSALGAEGAVLTYVKEYMSIWYLGVIAVVIPMIGNNIIRAMGDTKTPGLIMGFSAFINILLDPLLIFGIGPFPAMGITGAALATVFARSITAVVSVYILWIRERLFIFKKVPLKEISASFREILFIGIPNSLTRISYPLAQGVIVRLLAGYGPYAVAGFGIATRIERFALAPIMALGSVYGPFMGQNLGAEKYSRMNSGRKISSLFSLGAGLTAAAALFFAAPYAAGIFTSEPEIIRYSTLYMRIVPLSYGLWGIFQLATVALNVVKKPLQAYGWTMLQLFAVVVPLAFAGSYLAGVPGIFAGLSASYMLSGILIRLHIKKLFFSY
ncbi:MAG: MATE family efflux transporter [Elusimicrobiota bacterium]